MQKRRGILLPKTAKAFKQSALANFFVVTSFWSGIVALNYAFLSKRLDFSNFTQSILFKVNYPAASYGAFACPTALAAVSGVVC